MSIALQRGNELCPSGVFEATFNTLTTWSIDRVISYTYHIIVNDFEHTDFNQSINRYHAWWHISGCWSVYVLFMSIDCDEVAG